MLAASKNSGWPRSSRMAPFLLPRRSGHVAALQLVYRTARVGRADRSVDGRCPSRDLCRRLPVDPARSQARPGDLVARPDARTTAADAAAVVGRELSHTFGTGSDV